MTRTTLDPKLDVVFKLLFARPSNKRLLISLLTAILEPKSPIVDVKVLNPEVIKETIHAKGTQLDVLVELLDGSLVNLELQATPRGWRMSRGVFYSARVLTGQLKRGDDYDALNPVVGIFILGFTALSGTRYHSKFEMLEVHDHTQLSQDLTIHVLELPKLPLGAPALDAPGVLKWGKFFAARSDEELEQVAMSDPDLREAKVALEELSEDPVARRLAEERWLGEVIYRMSMAQERKEGREEGRTEGREEGRTEGREEGRTEGREEGRTEGLRDAVVRLGRVLNLEVTDIQRQRLATADAAEVQAILDHIELHRAWPDAAG